MFLSNHMKKVFKRFTTKYIKLDKHGVLIISQKIPFLDRVFLSKNNEKIYVIKTKKSHALNLLTAKDLFEYAVYLEFNFLFFRYSLKPPINLSKIFSNNAKYNLYSKEPIQKGLVVFESFFGKQYAGQPKYIYEYLLSLNLPYTFVWVYQKDTNTIPGNPTIVKRGSIEYFKFVARAEYLVNNIVFPFHNKRSETTYLQTWHGTPLKRLGFDIDVEGPEVNARENFYKESRNWDYLMTQNSYTSDILRRAFKFDKQIIELGYPHNDIFFQNNQSKIIEIKEKLNIPTNKKIILYASTWRDGDSNGGWSFNFTLKFDLLKWKKLLSEEYILLVRMHHLITDIKDMEEVKGFAFNVSNYDDIQELSLLSDILITDYSSVFFDYAVSRKPILFYAYDLKEYAEKLRGFYLDMHQDMPGPVLETDEELLSSIMNIDTIEIEYKNKYKKFIDTFCYLDNGLSAKKVVEKVFKDINE